MGISAKCAQCAYSTCPRGLNSKNWRDNVICNYFLRTGKMPDRGSDPRKCKQFKQKTEETLKKSKTLY